MSNRTECMIRLDDITPDMNMERFHRVKEVLDKYQICPLIGVVPQNRDETLHKTENNAEFWKKKIEDNISRDQKKTEALEEQGWKVIVVWECELKKDAELALSKIVKEMRK